MPRVPVLAFSLPLLALILPSRAQTSAPDNSLKPTLVATVDRFMLAWQKHDADMLSSTLAPEFTYVSATGVAPRPGVIAALTGPCVLTAYAMSDPQVLQPASDTAILIYKIHQTATCAGHPEPADTLNTDTLVRRNGKWLFLLTTSVATIPSGPNTP